MLGNQHSKQAWVPLITRASVVFLGASSLLLLYVLILYLRRLPPLCGVGLFFESVLRSVDVVPPQSFLWVFIVFSAIGIGFVLRRNDPALIAWCSIVASINIAMGVAYCQMLPMLTVGWNLPTLR